MALDIAAWNVNEAMGSRRPAEKVIGFIGQQQPDVAVLSEAYAVGSESLIPCLDAHLGGLGYDLKTIRYDDYDDRRDKHGLMVVARANLEPAFRSMRLAGRSALSVLVHDPETKEEVGVYGIHLDDRSESERRDQVDALLEYIEGDSLRPTVIAGDFNAMHASDITSQVLSTLDIAVRHLPESEPGPGAEGFKVARLGSLGSRLVSMTSGVSISMLEDAGFRDVDPSHSPTKGPAQLDHVMVNDGLTVVDFEVYTKSKISDHKAIRTTVEVV